MALYSQYRCPCLLPNCQGNIHHYASSLSQILEIRKEKRVLRSELSRKHTLCVCCQVRIILFNTQSAFTFCQAGMRLCSKDSSVLCANQEVFIQICLQSLHPWVFPLVCFFLVSVHENTIYNFSQTRISGQI